VQPVEEFRLVNGLVEAGLVKRVPNASNGRRVKLTLTETGEEMATRVSAVEATLYGFISEALEGQSLSESIAVLWRLVEGRPAGVALARRKRRVQETSEAKEG
jgi:DNA-binding MarR family transcriptional regulator